MKLFGNLWKIHSTMLVALALVLSGCGSGGSGDSSKSTVGNNGASSVSNPGESSIPDAENGIPGETDNPGSVVDNTNNTDETTNTLTDGSVGDVEIFIDENNAIDDLSLLDAGGVPTFGKRSKKRQKGKAKDIDKMYAIQYTSAGAIEKIFPMTKSGSRYILNSDLTNSRDYKFVFLGYENSRWTGSNNELYSGPTAVTTTIGTSGPANAINGSDGSTSFIRTSAQTAVKASISSVAGNPGVKIEVKDGGAAGNDIAVIMEEGVRATYFVGTIQNGNGANMISYRTVAGIKGNVSIKFQYHSEYSNYITGAVPNVAPTGISLNAAQLVDYSSNVYPRDVVGNNASPRDEEHFPTINDDYLIEEHAAYDTTSNTITLHYGASTSAHTLALLLQTQDFAIDTADVILTGATITTQAYSSAAQLVTSNAVADHVVRDTLNVISLLDASMNTTNGDLTASGNIDDDADKVEFNAGTSILTIKYNTTENGVNGTLPVYPITLTGNRPTTQVSGSILSTIEDLMKAYADASTEVRNLVSITTSGDLLGNITNTHPIITKLSGGQDASSNSAISNFDKSTNPSFVWKDALNVFSVDNSASTFNTSLLGLRTGTSISPHNPVAFDNLYKNFTYFGILHLKGEDIESKKSKVTTVEAKIVSSQSYRNEGNIGPAVFLIQNDTFTLGSATGEIILNIRNYFQQDISLDDLRITASIKEANLDADSGRISVALPVSTTNWAFTFGTGFVGTTVVSDTGLALTANTTTNAAPYILSGATVTDVFPASTGPTTVAVTQLFPSGVSGLQSTTITKKSRTEFVRNFQWEDETEFDGGTGTNVTTVSQAAQTDTVMYESDPLALDRGADIKSSFVTRNTADGSHTPNTAGEFLDLIYHLYYRPRSSVGTDIINVFIEDGTQEPTGNLLNPRDISVAGLGTLAEQIDATRSPTVALDGSILPYSDSSDEDLIYNTLSLEIPVDTVIKDEGGELEEPDALVSFAISFDTTASTDNDPSTMAVRADLTNARAGETYTYRWNWSRYFELDGDNSLIGMPAGAVLHGEGIHEITFSDATDKHPDFTSIRVTVRPSAGLDPEGTLRPFDPSTFDPTQSPALVENVDRDFVFLDNYDGGTDALDMSAAGLKAAVKLDTATDPTEAHLIITPRTNGAGELIASGTEIAEAIRFYLINSAKISALKIADSSFELLDVYAKGSQLDNVPSWGASLAGEETGEVLTNGRTADDNAGNSLSLNFADSTEYEKVRDNGSPQLTVHILDTVESHNGTIYLVDLSNAYPPVVNDDGETVSDTTYTFVNLATDGVTTNPVNQAFTLSVANDTDADGAVNFIMRVKRDTGGTNEAALMQERTVVVDGSALGAPITRENQFVAYWEVLKISDQSTNRLLALGGDNTNFWVIGDATDFVGSGADGDLDGLDLVNLIPIPARNFNLPAKSNGAEHEATLATDPDDPTNVALQHLLFSTRLILPTAASERDSYFVNFRFRPGTAAALSGTNPVPAIMTRTFTITVIE
ncbi:MAG: hypothetical protein COA79_10960 [Planctomycetota bacterium]|nr:MAG: hypothetical protein COA79_10960 [Planctomycetota bacterium]